MLMLGPYGLFPIVDGGYGCRGGKVVYTYGIQPLKRGTGKLRVLEVDIL